MSRDYKRPNDTGEMFRAVVTIIDNTRIRTRRHEVIHGPYKTAAMARTQITRHKNELQQAHINKHLRRGDLTGVVPPAPVVMGRVERARIEWVPVK